MRSLFTRTVPVILTALFLLQAVLLGKWQLQFGPLDNPVWYFVSGMLAAVIFLQRAFIVVQPTIGEIRKSLTRYLHWLVFVAGAVIVGNLFSELITVYPLDMLDTSFSDIYPQVHIMTDRFLHGEKVYADIPFNGYTLFPTYLPLTWMPFIPAEILGLDYRWVSYTICLAGILVYAIWLHRSVIAWWQKSLYMVLPFAGWLSYVWYHQQETAYSLESMIAGFYMLLLFSLFSKRPAVRILALMLCLLSRYSVVLWIPLYILVMYRESGKMAWRMTVYGVVILLVLYVIPFLIHDPSIFQQGYAYHDKAALAEWQPSEPDQIPGKHLHEGAGLAIFFFKYGKGEMDHRLQTLQQVHLLLTSMIVLLCGVLYLRFRPDKDLFLAGSLILYLTFFYHLIQIPYSYLFLTLLLMGSVLPVLLLRKSIS